MYPGLVGRYLPDDWDNNKAILLCKVTKVVEKDLRSWKEVRNGYSVQSHVHYVQL